MSDSVRPHRRQPTRLPRSWDSPGKNTGVGCHFLLQCMKVKSEREVTQSCPTLSDPWTAAHQTPPSMGFSRQEYWSGVPLPSLKHCAGKQYANSNIGTIFVGHFFNIMAQSMGSRTALDQILLLTLSGCLTRVHFLICAAVSS